MSSSSSLRSMLGEEEVFELVVDYLRCREYFDAEKILIQEREKNVTHGQPSVSKNNVPSTRLESLLERSWVTSLISEEEQAPLRKKVKRSNLDGYLPPLSEENPSGVLTEPEEVRERKWQISTQLVSFDACKDDPYGSASMPIYQTSTFAQPSATEFGPYDYTRSGNPTRAALERQMAGLEQGCRAFAFTSGMAALSCVSRLAKAGDEIILCDDSYGGTYRLLSRVASKNGISVRYVDLAGPSGSKNLAAVISHKTKLVMLESPTNPLMRICDIAAISHVAHSGGHNALVSVDNTMLSPVLQNPLTLGADIVVHSATKYVCGHSDTMSGVIIVKDKSLADDVYFYQNAEGTGLAPFDCWLLLRGIKTMALRMERAQENAMRVAEYLMKQPAVSAVFYAGLPNYPNASIHRKQARGGGAVVSFTTGSLHLSRHIVSTTKLFKVTVSFGSVNSLISLPGAMSHASIPEEVRKAREFPEDLVRLSIGIEDINDLLSDLSQAFATYDKSAISS